MYKWDWYQSTVHRPIDAVISAFKNTPINDLSDFKIITPKNGYTYGGAFVRGDHRICSLFWGGNPGVNILSTGSDAPALAEVLRVQLPDHLPTRVDACVDLARAGLFDTLTAGMMEFAVLHRIKIDQQGDWRRGRARTLYLGSRSSPVFLRVYEKGCQMLDQFADTSADPDWVRIEVEVKPRHHARPTVSQWSPEQAFTCACKWLSELWQFLGWGSYTPFSIGTVREDKDTDRQRRALARQFGRILDQWIIDAGSLDAFYSDFCAIRDALPAMARS